MSTKDDSGRGGGVLGNDPFKRGAAPTAPAREQKMPDVERLAQSVAAEPARPSAPRPIMTPVQPKSPPAEAKAKRAPPKPPPPPVVPKIVVPKPKTGEHSPARRAVNSFASQPPKGSSPEPKVTAPDRPVMASFVPPPPRANSPTPKVTAPDRPRGVALPPLPQYDPIAHPASPTLKHNPLAHEGSPTIGVDPVAHSESPEARHAPEPHEGSPELRAEFTPHGTSPDLVELGVSGTTPHSGSPAVVAVLKDTEPVRHPDSPEVIVDRVTSLETPPRDVTEGITAPLIQAATGLLAAARSALGFGAKGPVDTWGKDEALTRALHPIGDFLYDRYFRVTVEGSDLIPSGPSIIVANHSGALPLDGPMLYYALQRERRDLKEARWLVEDQVFHAPVLGVLINRIGAVRAHPENAVRLLEEGRPVIVFPEGFLGISKPFTQRYQLKRFGRGGYVKLALKQQVPIVPVAITGAEESMPLIARLPAGPLGLPYLPLTPPPLPARWRIRFSEPVTVDGSPDDLAYVQEQNDRVRDTIAGMLASMLG